MRSESESPSAVAPRLAVAFIGASRKHLADEYLPKIVRCLEELDEADVWWRPTPHANSVGNLVLHLCGNVRQWVVHGIGGQPDVRERPSEFSTTDGWTPAELRTHLEDTIEAVDRTLGDLQDEVAANPASLLTDRVIQGISTTVLEALYHVVEHFSHHAGQIIWITKARTRKDLGFWVVEDGTARPNW